MKIKAFILFFWSISATLFAQDRNESVRELNEVIVLLTEYSRQSVQWYVDVTQLDRAIYRSKEQLAVNYFYCSKIQKNGLVYFTGIEEYLHLPHLTPTENNYLPAYQSDFKGWLKQHEWAKKEITKPSATLAEIIPELKAFTDVTEKLFLEHLRLLDYVSLKEYENDDAFKVGKELLRSHAALFKEAYLAFHQLNDKVHEVYAAKYPPNKTHIALQEGLQEIEKTIGLLDKWEKEMYQQLFATIPENDVLLHQYYEEGSKKDTLYLSGTKGFGVKNNGFMLHSKYRYFYNSMHSTIFWIAKEKTIADIPISLEEKKYNRFVMNVNQVFDIYNDYVDVADGKLNYQAALCCLSISDVDTNQNVLLKHVRFPFKYSYQEVNVISENIEEDQQRINLALPHHLVYLLDVSGSMVKSGSLNLLKEQANYLVQLQRESDKLSIVTFSGFAQVILTQETGANKPFIKAKIDSIGGGGLTNLLDGMEKTSKLFSPKTKTKEVEALLILSDGKFEWTQPVRDYINQFIKQNVRIYVVYLGKALSPKKYDSFVHAIQEMGCSFYDVNRINLKEILLQIATSE